MITDFSRGHICLEVSGRTVRILGEMFFTKDDKVGFVVYADTIKRWEGVGSNNDISDSDKDKILEDLKREFEAKSRVLEIQGL